MTWNLGTRENKMIICLLEEELIFHREGLMIFYILYFIEKKITSLHKKNMLWNCKKTWDSSFSIVFLRWIVLYELSCLSLQSTYDYNT